MNTRHSKDRPLQSASGRILATDDGAESTGHPQTMGDRHGTVDSCCAAQRFLEQRRAPWAKGSSEAEGHLGDPSAAADPYRTRKPALFNLAIDSKLRSCDLVRLRVRDVCHGTVVAARTIAMEQKTQRPVQFEIAERTEV